VQVLIRAVTFDLWNTLIENRDYTNLRVDFLAAVLGKMGYSFTKDDVAEAFALALAYVYGIWENGNHRFVPTRERLDYILQKLSTQLPEDLKQNIITYFEEIALSDPPLLTEGTKETLEYLGSKYELGIISDSGWAPGSVLRKVLMKNGVLNFFDATVFSDEVGYNKPHRMMFEKGLSILSAEPSEVIHVGDLLETDVAGAKAFGMKTVWLNKEGKNPTGAHKPDFTINTISEIVSILDKLNQQVKNRSSMQ
jgi:HAD superfamily hydrolase (TIGR01549 family)